MDVDWQADLDRWLRRLSRRYGTRRGRDVPFLCRGFDWSRRPQERSADGGARW